MFKKLKINVTSAPRLLVAFVVVSLLFDLLSTVIKPTLTDVIRLVLGLWLYWYLLDRSKNARNITIALCTLAALVTLTFITKFPFMALLACYLVAFGGYLLFSKKYRAWLEFNEAVIKD
jgi:hypothetical protein